MTVNKTQFYETKVALAVRRALGLYACREDEPTEAITYGEWVTNEL